MKMRVHELHPAVVHLPLTLLPLAAAIDTVALFGKNRALEDLGRYVWWGGVASTILAGAAGAAASQEVKAEEKHTRDMIFVHGAVNSAVALAGLGMAIFRTRRAPTWLSAAASLTAIGAAAYSAWLGGELTYAHGVGVKAMAPYDPNGMGDSPALFSREAPARLIGDAVKGFAWIARRTFSLATRREALDTAALGFSEEKEELLRETHETAELGTF